MPAAGEESFRLANTLFASLFLLFLGNPGSALLAPCPAQLGQLLERPERQQKMRLADQPEAAATTADALGFTSALPPISTVGTVSFPLATDRT